MQMGMGHRASGTHSPHLPPLHPQPVAQNNALLSKVGHEGWGRVRSAMINGELAHGETSQGQSVVASDFLSGPADSTDTASSSVAGKVSLQSDVAPLDLCSPPMHVPPRNPRRTSLHCRRDTGKRPGRRA